MRRSTRSCAWLRPGSTRWWSPESGAREPEAERGRNILRRYGATPPALQLEGSSAKEVLWKLEVSKQLGGVSVPPGARRWCSTCTSATSSRATTGRRRAGARRCPTCTRRRSARRSRCARPRRCGRTRSRTRRWCSSTRMRRPPATGARRGWTARSASEEGTCGTKKADPEEGTCGTKKADKAQAKALRTEYRRHPGMAKYKRQIRSVRELIHVK